MDEGATSWIWRTSFKHSFCHCHNPDNMASVPLPVQEEKSSREKSTRPYSSSSMTQNHISAPRSVKTVQNPAMSKQRSLSPLTEKTVMSNSFKEARLEQKRSSTPSPQRSKTEITSSGNVISNNELKGSKSIPESKCRKARTSTSPLRHLGSMRISDGPKSRKESSWAAKYFDHTGVKVSAEEATDEWTADLTKLLIGRRFAHGAHSQLHHGLYKEKPVAVKIITVPDDDENGDKAATLETEFIREVYLLSKIRHQNVIKLIAACRKPTGFFVVMEYLSGGSLRAFLHKLELEHEILPLPKIISVALDIARGMEFIHSKGVIHRDLKPENILIDEEFRMKIADFGIACEEAYCDALASDSGTYRWMAPEMYKQKSYGKKVDVYSFGLILWEIVSGSIPFKTMDPIPAALAVAYKDLRPDIPMDCPPAMKALIEQCWFPHPHKRPEFWQIVKVLENFQTSLSGDGTSSLPHNPICQDHKKGLFHWIHKLGPVHSPTSSSAMPKFS